jgi:hypothetical protein
MRRLIAIVPAAILCLSTFASSVSADTGPSRSEFEFDRVTAEFAFSEGGRDFVGSLLIDRTTSTGAAITSFFFFSGVIVTCDNGTPDDPSDDFEAQDLIDFTANETSPATLSIDDKFRSAIATGVGTGQRIHLEACTDARTSTTESISWALDLAGIGSTTHTTDVEKFPNDDGTVTMQTIKTAQRSASGSVDVGAMTLVADPAALTHFSILESTH